MSLVRNFHEIAPVGTLTVSTHVPGASWIRCGDAVSFQPVNVPITWIAVFVEVNGGFGT